MAKTITGITRLIHLIKECSTTLAAPSSNCAASLHGNDCIRYGVLNSEPDVTSGKGQSDSPFR